MRLYSINVSSELTPALTRLNGMITVGIIAMTADLGAPMNAGVTRMFIIHITTVVTITPVISALMAVFFVLLRLYMVPMATATMPVAIKCMMNP